MTPAIGSPLFGTHAGVRVLGESSDVQLVDDCVGPMPRSSIISPVKLPHSAPASRPSGAMPALDPGREAAARSKAGGK